MTGDVDYEDSRNISRQNEDVEVVSRWRTLVFEAGKLEDYDDRRHASFTDQLRHHRINTREHDIHPASRQSTYLHSLLRRSDEREEMFRMLAIEKISTRNRGNMMGSSSCQPGIKGEAADSDELRRDALVPDRRGRRVASSDANSYLGTLLC